MNRFYWSDPHFGHANIYSKSRTDGTPVRPWASTVEEGDEMLIEAYNSVVGPNDKCYVMGDFTASKRYLALATRLNGKKVLIKGNHDNLKLKEYLPYFDDIRAVHVTDDAIYSHYPIHASSIPKTCLGNVHGHTHDFNVMMRNDNGDVVEDPRYLNICTENVGLFPLSQEEIVDRLRARAELVAALNDDQAINISF